MTDQGEVERRYGRIREALARDGLDAAIVSGNEYTGFEGAVTYLSGFGIVHRYAYVLLPLDGEPAIVFPSEARYVGEHGTTWIEEQVFVDRPGEWLRDRIRDRAWKRVGVFGLDYIMAVRDYRALEDAADLVPWDVEFDHARAVKSDVELESVRESARINEEGFWTFLETFDVGRTEAEILAPCEKLFVESGCGRLTMDMVLVGDEAGRAQPEFRIASSRRRIGQGDVVLPSLEVAGPGGHWVEVSRAIKAGGEPNDETKRMAEAYEASFEATKGAMRAGATAHELHRAVSKGFTDRGYKLGHVTGHSIGMTMIEFPKVGEGVDTPLEQDMVLSVHPHVISEDGLSCLYMQETWLVTTDGGEPLSTVPMRIFDASDARPA